MILFLNILFVSVFVCLCFVIWRLIDIDYDYPVYTDVDPKYEDAMNALRRNEKTKQSLIYFISFIIYIMFILFFTVNCEIYFLQPRIEYDNKAELKSGEVVDAKDCYTINDKATCNIKIDGYEDKEYIVTSYREKTLVESMLE